MHKTANDKVQEIWQALDGAMYNMENGGPIDMASIDKKVRDFCSDIAKLPADEARQYKAKLPDIIEHLNKIVDKLNNQKTAMEKEFDGLSNRHRAHAAYGSVTKRNNPYNSGNE